MLEALPNSQGKVVNKDAMIADYTRLSDHSSLRVYLFTRPQQVWS